MAMLKHPLYPVPDTEGLCESLKTAKRDPMTGVIKDSFELAKSTCCEFCEIIRQAVPPDWKRTQVTMHGYKIEISNDTSPDPANELELDNFDSDWVDTRKIVLCPLKDVPCPWGLSHSRIGGSAIRAPPGINGSDSLSKADAVVKRCLAMHSCGNAASIELPTRIIDVGESADSGNVRLIDTVGRKAPYVCLSHCWGGEQPLKTTKKNLLQNLTCISWLSMPKLYQDAVLVARKLRIRYLWIDSLCIVQDDFNDWVRESVVMGDIYERAFLTISAISAPNCLSSLFETSQSECFVLEGVTSAGIPYAYAVSPSHYIRPESHPQDIRPDRKKWPLLDRAWVFQERILSSRVLYFTGREVIFQCEQDAMCECGFVSEIRMRSKKHYHKALLEVSPTRLMRLWFNFVEVYSCLRCSSETDRLPAFSGFAQRFAKLQPSARYLGGLWDTSLDLGLLWLAKDTKIPTKVPRQFVAPSWSWAATHRGVVFAVSDHWYSPNDAEKTFSVLIQYFQVVSADCQLATSDLTGQISVGQLTVSGRLFDAILHGEARYLNIQASNVDIATNEKWERIDKPVLYPDSGDWCTEGLENSRLVCLPLARIRRTSKDDEHEDIELTMVLTCPRNDKAGYYRRVGMIQQRSSGGNRMQTREVIEEYWHKNRSPFEFGGKEAAITII